MYHQQITTMKGQMPTANTAQNTIDNKMNRNEKKKKRKERTNGKAYRLLSEMNKSDNKFENEINLTWNQQ